MDKWEKRARAEDMFPTLSRDETVIGSVDVWRDRALQLGREMADERAEEIAKAIDVQASYWDCDGALSSTPGEWWRQAARLARSFISKPKTREQVLEEALRYYASCNHVGGNEYAHETEPGSVARRALEWKP